MYSDLFVDGYDDMAIFQPTYLTDFYNNGFNTTEQNAVLKDEVSRPLHPQRRLRSARRRGRARRARGAWPRTTSSRASSSTPPNGAATARATSSPTRGPTAISSAAEKLGIKNIHVHKGPTILPLEPRRVRRRRHRRRRHQLPEPELHRRALRPAAPRRFLLDRDAGDQRLWRPRGGAAVHPLRGPDYFAHVISELLFWLGEDKLLFGSDYAHLDAAMAGREVHGLRTAGRRASRKPASS